MQAEVTEKSVQAGGLRLHYRESGTGAPVLLLHGWPTSSFLYRKILGTIGLRNRAIALDLPGFGQSDKPLDVKYSFPFYERHLTGFLDALGIGATGLTVHDLGGPVGLYWAVQHPERVSKLALLNTLVWPQLSWAVYAFGAALYTPGLRSVLVSPWGLRLALRIGVSDPKRLDEEAYRGTLAPFQTPEARKALIKSALSLHPGGLRAIAEGLPKLRVPVRVVYGARDRILPDVGKTMRRVASELPQTQVTCLPDCGHFLQEERPAEVGQMLADFFAPAPA